MDRRSKHLSSEERGVIFAEHGRGSSQGAIGRLLGRPASPICRDGTHNLKVDQFSMENLGHFRMEIYSAALNSCHSLQLKIQC